MKQGQGAATRRKQEKFYHAMCLGMRVAMQPDLQSFAFWLFDGNCGSGWNHDVDRERGGVMGSPITAHMAADQVGLPIRRRHFFACDRDRRQMEDLQRRLQDSRWFPGSYLVPCDNEDALELFGECIRQSGEKRPHLAIGALIVDPNGWFYRNEKDEGPPIAGLREFTARFGRIDIIFNLNVRTYHLSRAKGFDVLSPYDVLTALNKKHWLVGRHYMGNSRFWIAVGRNFATGDHIKIGLHHLHSVAAKEIMLDIEHARQEELLDAPRIRPLSNLSRVSQASGVSGGANGGDAAQQLSLSLWPAGDPGASLATTAGNISTVGNVRRAEQSEADLS